MKIRLVSIMVLCLMLLCGCTGSAYITNSTETADIPRKGDTFDVTVDQCIAILNEDLEKENLDLIPTEYEVVEHDYGTAYRCMISDILMIRFATYKDHGPGIVRIGLSSIDSVTYKKGKKTFNYTATKKDKKTADTYYQILCKNVLPKFNAKQYLKDGECDTSDMDIDLDEFVFFSNTPSVDTWYGSELIQMDEVFSSDKLYKKYEEELYDDDEMFLYHVE